MMATCRLSPFQRGVHNLLIHLSRLPNFNQILEPPGLHSRAHPLQFVPASWILTRPRPIGGATANNITYVVSSTPGLISSTLDRVGLALKLEPPDQTLAELAKVPAPSPWTQQPAKAPYWSKDVVKRPLNDAAALYTSPVMDVHQYRAGSSLQGQSTSAGLQVWSRAAIYPYAS
jgi:hypothetical protein